MAVELEEAYVPIIPSLRGFSQRLRAELSTQRVPPVTVPVGVDGRHAPAEVAAVARAAQAVATRSPVQLKVVIDQRGVVVAQQGLAGLSGQMGQAATSAGRLTSALTAAAGAARRLPATLQSAANTARAVAVAGLFLAGNWNKVVFAARLAAHGATALTARLLGSIGVAGAAGSALRRLGVLAGAAGRLIHGLIPAAVVAHLARFAAGMRFAGRAAQSLAGDLSKVASALLVLRVVAGLTQRLTRLGRAMAIVVIGGSALIGVLSAVGAAAAAAAAAIGAGLAGAGAAAIGTLGPAVGALKVGFSGLKDGAEAFMQSTKNAAAQAKQVETAARGVAQAEKGVEQAHRGVAQANKGVEQAIRGVTQAERGVQDAKKASRVAEVELTRARKDALNQIEDLNRELKGAALSERDAQLSLAEARRDLQDLGKDGAPVDYIDRERAVLRVQQAEQRLADTQNSNRDLAEQTAEANAKGVENSDLVAQAKDRVAAAHQSEADAQQSLVDANDQVAEAQQRVADANEAVADAQQQLADAKQALTDAQNPGSDDPFAKMIGDRIAPFLTAMQAAKEATQDAFSTGISPALNAVGEEVDRLSPKLSGLAGRLGGVVGQTIDRIRDTGAFDQMLAASDNFVAKTGHGFASLGAGVSAFIGNASQAMSGGAAGVGGALDALGQKLAAIKPGQVTAAWDRLKNTLSNIWQVLSPIFGLFSQLSAVAAPALAPGFAAIGQAIRDAIPGIVQMAEKLMPALSQVMQNLAPAIPAIVHALQPLGSLVAALAPSIAAMLAVLAPLAPHLVVLVSAVKAATAAMALYQTLTLAWSVASKVAGNAAKIWAGVQWLLNAAMSANPIGLVVVAIGALVAAFVTAYQRSETFRNIVQGAWEGIKTAVAAAWDTYIKPAIDKFMEGVRALGAVVMWLWDNVVKPYWGMLGDGIALVWTGVIMPAFENLKTGLGLIGSAFKFIWDQVIKPKWDELGRGITWIIDNLIVPGWEKLKTGLGVLRDAFSAAVAGIGDKWARLKGLLAKPVNVFIGVVYNNGLRKAWNATAGKIGLPEMPEMQPIPEFNQGGTYAGVYPGYTPGRDTGVIAVGGGEAIMRPEWTHAVGPGYIDDANTAARSGGIGGVRRFLGAYAAGGVVDPDAQPWAGGGGEANLKPAAILARRNVHKYWPEISTIGGYRAQDPYPDHPSGLALDIMVSDVSLGTQVNDWLHANMGPLALNYTIWQQYYRPAGGGGNLMEDRGSPTQNHMDHIHALFNPNGAPGIQDGGVGSSGGGGGLFSRVTNAFRNLAADLFEKPVHAMIGAVPDPVGPGEFGHAPKRLAATLGAKAIEFVRGTAEKKDNASAPPPGTAGGGAEQWRDLAAKALVRVGFTPPERYVENMLKQIMRESSGNPAIAQQITDVNGTGDDAGVGLLQIIPGTWAAYRDPELPDDRRDPFANMVGALRYVKSLYGDPNSIWPTAPGQGYDTGGMWPSGTAGFNASGKPEAVLTNPEWQMFAQFIRVLEEGLRRPVAAQQPAAEQGTPGEPTPVVVTDKDGKPVDQPQVAEDAKPAIAAANQGPTVAADLAGYQSGQQTSYGSLPLTAEGMSQKAATLGHDFLKAQMDQAASDLGIPTDGFTGRLFKESINYAMNFETNGGFRGPQIPGITVNNPTFADENQFLKNAGEMQRRQMMRLAGAQR